MAKYRLLAQHYSEEDKLLDPDTLVGDGTPHLWTRPPTPEMEGLDAESRRLVKLEHARVPGGGNPVDDLPMAGKARK